jgi:elongation factor G
MMREFRVDGNVGRPQVAYKETITLPVRAEGRHVRQSGGKGQYGHCIVQFEPQERARGTSSSTRSLAARSPVEYIAPIDAGIRESMLTGGQAGFRWST